MEVLKLETWINEFSPQELVPDKIQEYLDFVVQAVERYDPNRYSEWHHVMPKCIDLEKKFRDQGVRINGADHFRAHRKLVDCFIGRKKAILAYILMKMGKQSSQDVSLTPEEYEEAKRVYSESSIGSNNPFSGHSTDQWRDKLSRAHKGKVLTDSHREHIRQSVSGEGNPFYGKHHTEESRLKMSQTLSDGRLKGSNHPLYGKHFSKESKGKMSQAKKGKIWINNGEEVKMINQGDEIPDGWVRGRGRFSPGKRKESVTL